MDELLHIVYQMLEFLPKHIQNALNHLNMRFLYELRLRAEKPITVNYNGRYRYLGAFGITDIREMALKSSMEEVADCVYRAGKYSVYSVEEQIKQGFLTAESGVRIGLAGEYVLENGKVLALRSFSSLCIRIPHEIFGCGEEIFKCCMSDRIKNLLVASPPGLGKTTILRDLGRIISETTQKNVLICDERGEISAGVVGDSCDVVKYANKTTAFETGIRAMRPEIIITDELSDLDCSALEKAVSAGITVIASAHFSAIERVTAPFFKIFERIVILEEDAIGKIKGIYNQKGEETGELC